MDTIISNILNEENFRNIYINYRTAHDAFEYIEGILFMARSMKAIDEKEYGEFKSMNDSVWNEFRYSDNDE